MSEQPGCEAFVELSNSLYRLFSFRGSVQRKCANLGEMECRLLTLLTAHDEPVRMNNLAERLQVSHSRVTRLIDSLVKKGLVSRIQSQRDRRSWQVKISAFGINATRHISDETRAIQERLIAQLPPDETAAIYRHLKTYVETYQRVLTEKDNEYSSAEPLAPWSPQSEPGQPEPASGE